MRDCNLRLTLALPRCSRSSTSPLLQRAIPAAVIHIHRPHLDAVLAGVAHQLGRGVEAHRLAVDQRGGERGRVVVLEPGRDVHQQREAGGVRFGKAVLAEAAIC